MSYINKTNIAGEEIIETFSFTKWEYLWKMCNPLVWLLLFIPIPIMWFKRWCCNIGVTNKRFVWKSGFIARDTWEIRLDAIEGCDIKNTFLGRIFGYGTLHITGRGNKSIEIDYLGNIMGVKRTVEAARADYVGGTNR